MVRLLMLLAAITIQLSDDLNSFVANEEARAIDFSRSFRRASAARLQSQRSKFLDPNRMLGLRMLHLN